MESTTLIYQIMSVLIASASFLAVLRGIRIKSVNTHYLFYPSLYTFVLVCVQFAAGKDFPVDIFCSGTVFMVMGAMPMSPERFKSLSMIAFCIISIILCFVGREWLLLLIPLYYLVCWNVEFIHLASGRSNVQLPRHYVAKYFVHELYAVVPFTLSVISFLLTDSSGPFCLVIRIFALLTSWIFYLLVFYLLYKDKTIILTPLRLDNLCRTLFVQYIAENAHDLAKDNDEPFRKQLYSKFLRYMDEQKPYLESDLKEIDVANALGTNKTYLSKCISENSKSSFPTIINKYRIDYAMEEFRKDPNLKIVELSRISGFGSDSHFSLAFRNINQISPREWCTNYRFELMCRTSGEEERKLKERQLQKTDGEEDRIQDK